MLVLTLLCKINRLWKFPGYTPESSAEDDDDDSPESSSEKKDTGKKDNLETKRALLLEKLKRERTPEKLRDKLAGNDAELDHKFPVNKLSVYVISIALHDFFAGKYFFIISNY